MSAGPIPAPSPLFCTQGGFKPFQHKPVVIAGRDLGFLWILAQTTLLSISQGKCTDSLIYVHLLLGLNEQGYDTDLFQ